MSKAIKISEPGEEEVIYIKIDPFQHPKAYKAKFDEFINSGMSKKEAHEELLKPFELELINSPGLGMFLIESTAIEGGAIIVDPYTGIQTIQSEE